MPTMSRSSTTTDLLHNPHPGEMLKVDFLEPMGLSEADLARAIGVPADRVWGIVRGEEGITADTDLRLARYLRMSEGFFMGLQTEYELMEQGRAIGAQLEAISPRA